MMNIATLTLNPTIDVAYSIDRLAHTDKLRAPEQKCDPGGGGINVARVFVRLGGNARCVYMSGGSTGVALDALLDLHQLVRECVPIAGETRISTTVLEQSSGHEYRVVPAGPVVSEAEWRACLDRLARIDCDYLVLSGSLPRGVPEDFYAQVAAEARRRGVRTVLDSSGDALKAAVAAGGLEMIKPNLKEFQQLIGEAVTDPAEIGKAAQEIARSSGARLVAVSLSERGGILATADHVFECPTPKVETASSVGAGDSCVAAMVHGLAAGRSDEDAFRFGIAAGAAALLTPGTDLARAEDIERLFQQIGSHS
ncbi:MAG: 1-phosphofructokinase family hexose kinase [Pseudomonadota bacterium]